MRPRPSNSPSAERIVFRDAWNCSASWDSPEVGSLAIVAGFDGCDELRRCAGSEGLVCLLRTADYTAASGKSVHQASSSSFLSASAAVPRATPNSVETAASGRELVAWFRPPAWMRSRRAAAIFQVDGVAALGPGHVLPLGGGGSVEAGALEAGWVFERMLSPACRLVRGVVKLATAHASNSAGASMIRSWHVSLHNMSLGRRLTQQVRTALRRVETPAGEVGSRALFSIGLSSGSSSCPR